MITGFFLNIIYTILNYVIGLLWTLPFPQVVIDGWNYIWSLMNSVNFLFPINQLVLLIAVWVILMKTGLFVYITKLIASAARGHIR